MSRQQKRHQQRQEKKRVLLPVHQHPEYFSALARLVGKRSRGEDIGPDIEKIALRFSLTPAQVRDTLPPDFPSDVFSGPPVQA